MKLTYKESHQKKFLRSRVIPNGTSIIGLAGPDLVDYVTFCKDKHYKDISIWEYDKSVMVNQLPLLKKVGRGTKINYHYGDILSAPVQENTFYDLDFCSSIVSLKTHIEKFRKNFAITVSEMMQKQYSSLDIFLKYRKETLSEKVVVNDRELLITTNEGNKFAIYSYCDSSPMLIIKSI